MYALAFPEQKKIEFDINTECQNAVQTVTLDGQKVSPSYSRHPNFNALVFKVGAISSTPAKGQDGGLPHSC